MLKNNMTDSKNYSVPKKIQKSVLQATIQKTQEQVAHSDLMIAFYRHQAEEATTKDLAGKLGMQADKLEEGRKLNIEMLEWLENGG